LKTFDRGHHFWAPTKIFYHRGHGVTQGKTEAPLKTFDCGHLFWAPTKIFYHRGHGVTKGKTKAPSGLPDGALVFALTYSELLLRIRMP
jgi:hypothetical protein